MLNKTLVYIHLLTIICLHDKAAVITKYIQYASNLLVQCIISNNYIA